MVDGSLVITPVLNWAVDCVVTAAGVAAIWALKRGAAYLHLKADDVLVTRLQEAVPRAVAIAEAKGHEVVANLHPAALTISNPIERMAASYLLKQFPSLVKRLDMSPEQVGAFVQAWLAKRDADAAAPVVAGQVEAPAVPSPTDAPELAWGTAASFAGP